MGNVEIPEWLKGLPLAPEFRPTDTEFADPIAYISKIEKEASAFGICKVIPPLPKPSKRYVLCNLNKSLSKCPELGDEMDSSNVSSLSRMGLGDHTDDGELRAVFTTRQQELGQSVKRTKGAVKENPQVGAQKQVWQSGEIYTLEQFESKSKAFARNMLGMIKEVNSLVVEALFWKAASDKPIYVEYANDVPGSGFGDPEGQFRYFHKQRRKRASYRSYRRGTDKPNNMKIEVDNINKLGKEVDSAYIKNESSMALESNPKSSLMSPTSVTKDILRSSKQYSSLANNDMEGSAGWKLSNSPWNLQVIARSPGSLTRFMPDDIPGVTSPMIYIGMLFSWFAWHVEDHELHSMNFLHTGSPKTWYAVPGDYAFAFEEVICTEAYGGSIDRLGALTLLGEKTTLLSPEVVVSSGIPCCRLVQNPGEFVVTFPRAYHVGFSHGFNCGEAANFGTPQWLQVAKEAAVRRAAMNYLPMLSHQQLLYLLTMSFVSRVPRYLLPGARSSRLRDRQKEDRELAVKKAFIEDVLTENKNVYLLLAKDSTYHVAIWNPDLLPHASNDSELPAVTPAVATTPRENFSQSHCGCSNNTNENDLFKEMSLYMETLNDLYADDDDLSCDFQIDSGTLACVACGILGFPFMSVVQPSERASVELLSADHIVVEETSGVKRSVNSAEPVGNVKASVSDDLPNVPDHSFPPRNLPVTKGWNTSSKFLRPRIFCLEHAIQIEELLQSKGGANLLIICHSDYQRMKAHATSVAEEINSPFSYHEVSSDSASQEHLNLIHLAIDDEEHDESGEDWTSKLGVNLQYCVKVRKKSTPMQVQHALSLSGLFYDRSPNSDYLNVKWQSRRSRSRIKLNQPSCFSSCDKVVTDNVKPSGIKSGGICVKEEKLIQYSRRKFRVKIGCSTSGYQGHHGEHLTEGISIRLCEDSDNHTGKSFVTDTHNVSTTQNGSSNLVFSPTEMSEMRNEVHKKCGSVRSISSPSKVAGSLVAGLAAVDSNMEQLKNQALQRAKKELGTENVDKSKACLGPDREHEINTTGKNSENERSCATKISIRHTSRAETVEMHKDHMENIHDLNKTFNVVSEDQSKADADIVMNEASGLANSAISHFIHPPRGQGEIVGMEKSCTNSEVDDHVNMDTRAQQELQSSSSGSIHQRISHNGTQISQKTTFVEESDECPRESCAIEDEMQQEFGVMGGSGEEKLIPSHVGQISQVAPLSVDKSFGIRREACSAVNSCNGLAVEKDLPKAIHALNKSEGESLSLSDQQTLIDHPTSTPVEEFSEVPRGNSCKADLHTGLTLNADSQLESPTVAVNSLKQFGLDCSTQKTQNPFHSFSDGQDSVVRSHATGNLSAGVIVDVDLQLEIASCDRVTRDDELPEILRTTSLIREKEPVFGLVSQVNQSVSSPIQNSSRAEEESCNGENMLSCKSEPESIESRVLDPRPSIGKGRKRKNKMEHVTENKLGCNGFIRSPCEGLRPRAQKDRATGSGVDSERSAEENAVTKRARKPSDISVHHPKKKEIAKRSHECDIEGCCMSFETKEELALHKRNRCPYEGCEKRFSSHRYAIIHQRVHEDDRPLRCPWKGCSMSFKWAWARTEHIRVHTGEKPYQCKVKGCGRSFRFVSDFSRHRRKTGHYMDGPS
uniref:Lysine-specific demethylase ELF6 n=2 Tax=Rhizophora mucronata TaxID=61149 RepID=A0A2P2JMH8_RHIMU